MGITETVTVINKSGKVVSTGKHLINIFRDAKDAYNDKKASLQAENQARIRHKNAQKVFQAAEETRSVASSRHSRSSRRSHRHRRERDGEGSTRPPLTDHNLYVVEEGSVVSNSRRSRRSTSHHDDRSLAEEGIEYKPPYFETAGPSQISLVRRHTDVPPQLPFDPTATQLTRFTAPPYHDDVPGPYRSSSVPDLHAESEEEIDMNLAYGPIPHASSLAPEEIDQAEVEETMSKLDALLLEAQCLQHTASTIISSLQANPEAMAAVALTLAELSNLLTKMSPAIIGSLKSASPAIFALLASPQFLIAGGVAFGVTVVMFGGFKIIKKIQASAEAKAETSRLEEPLAFAPRAFQQPLPFDREISFQHQLDYDPEIELSSIDSWRRGIADAEAVSAGTSVDGEFISPEAERQNKERTRERARGERAVEGSVISGRSRRTVRKVSSESTIRRKDVPPPRSSTSKAPGSEAGRSRKSHHKKKRKEVLMIEEKPKPKKGPSSTLTALFKKGKGDREKRESVLSLRPKTIEM